MQSTKDENNLDGLKQILRNCDYSTTIVPQQTQSERNQLLHPYIGSIPNAMPHTFWANLIKFECPEDMYRICIKTSHASHLNQWLWLQSQLTATDGATSELKATQIQKLHKTTVVVLYIILLKHAKASITEAKVYHEFFESQHRQKLDYLQTLSKSDQNCHAGQKTIAEIQQRIILITRDNLTPSALSAFVHPEYDFKHFKLLFLQRNIMEHAIYQPHHALSFSERVDFWRHQGKHIKLDELPPLDPLDPIVKMHEWPVGTLVHVRRSYPQQHDYWRIVKPRKFSFCDQTVKILAEMFCFLYGLSTHANEVHNSLKTLHAK